MSVALVDRPTEKPPVGRRPSALITGQNYQRLVLVLALLLTAATIVTHIGFGLTAVLVVVLAVAAAVRVLWRQRRGVVVSAASTMAWWFVVLVLGYATDPADMWAGGFAYYGAYLVGLPALTLVVWGSRRTDFSIGTTVVLAHVAMMATLPARLIHLEASSAPAIGVLLGGLVVWRRTRWAPQSPLSSRRGRRLATRARQIGFSVVSTLLVVAALMLGSPGTAHAIWPFSQIKDSATEAVHDMLCGLTKPDMSQQPVGAGPESWLSNKNLAGIPGKGGAAAPDSAEDAVLPPDADMSQYTLYEISGLRGLNWVNWQYNPGSTANKPENCSIGAWMWTMAGNAVFTANLYLLQVTIALKEIAQSENPIAWLYDSTDSAVANLFVHFVVPAMGIAMIFSAIALAVGAVRGGNSRDRLGKVAASLAVMVTGGFVYGGLSVTDSGPTLENPDGSGFYVVASFLDETFGSMNDAIATGILSQIEGANTDRSFCKEPVGAQKHTGQRVSSCVLAETLGYRPWAIGQFGPAASKPITVNDVNANRYSGSITVPPVQPGQSATVAAGLGLPCYTNYDQCGEVRAYLIAQQGGPAISKRVNDCLASTDDYERLNADACIPYFAVAKQLSDKITQSGTGATASTEQSDEAVTMFTAYSGGNGLQRLTQAASSLAGTLVVAITLLTLAVITLVWHMMLFALFMLGGVTFAIGSYMGKTHLVRTWVVDVLHTFTARAAYSFAMTLIIFVTCLVFRSGAIDPGMKILLVALILYGFWKLIHKIDEYIRPAEGSLNMNVADQAQQKLMQAGRTSKRTASTSAGLGMAAGRDLARGRRGFTGQTIERSGRAALGAAKGVDSAERSMRGAMKGAGVGTLNALGGQHKANNEAARELGAGKGKMAVRRTVTGLTAGTRGAWQGGYQGARGRVPTYQRGSIRPLDSALSKADRGAERSNAKAKEVAFQAQYLALRMRRDSPAQKLEAKKRQEREAAKEARNFAGPAPKRDRFERATRDRFADVNWNDPDG